MYSIFTLLAVFVLVVAALRCYLEPQDYVAGGIALFSLIWLAIRI